MPRQMTRLFLSTVAGMVVVSVLVALVAGGAHAQTQTQIHAQIVETSAAIGPLEAMIERDAQERAASSTHTAAPGTCTIGQAQVLHPSTGETITARRATC